MSRKTRIFISCILVVFAFSMGLLAYAQANGNPTALADGGTGFFVDGNGKIAIPSGGTDATAKQSRGTEDNPFFVLEIAPWEGLAHFGYLIDGCEPVDIWKMCVDEKSGSVYGTSGNSLYTSGADFNYAYWEDEVPDWLTKLPPGNNGTIQYGEMVYVGDGKGNYKLVNGKCEKAEGGDYQWEWLSVNECKAIQKNWEEGQKYTMSERKQGESFLYCFNDPYPVHYEGTIKTLTHKNTFLRESIGLAYDYVDGKRISLPEAEVQERIANYHSVVYTVTPEDLNMNLALIRRADLIVFASDASASEAIKAYEDGYAKPEYFSHNESMPLGKRIANKKGADFTTNQLDWSTVLEIYDRALDKEKACPVIWDTHIYSKISSDHTKTVKLDGTFANGTKVNQSNVGTQNNLYKLYLLLYQMPAATFDVLYGEPRNFATAPVDRADVTDKQGKKLQTGLLGWYASADANSYWGQFSLYPWELLPESNSVVYTPVLDSLEIMGDGGNDVYHFSSGAAQNCVRNGFFLTNGGTQFFSTFEADSGVAKNQYNYDIYEYFRGMGLDKESLTPAECLYYLLHGLTADSAKNTDSYKILELQPSPDYHTELFWRTFFATYANTTGTVTVDKMTTSEFIGKNLECISEYDMIYIGMDKLTTDPTMHPNFTYAHTGRNFSFTDISSYKRVLGWLKSGNNDIENHFVYSGNDLTVAAKEKLKEYVGSGAALLFGNGFFSKQTKSGEWIVSGKVDRNSYIYKLQAEISDELYEDALAGIRERDDAGKPSNKEGYPLIDSALALKTKIELRAALARARSVELVVHESPILYDGTKSDAEKYINYYNNSNRTLRYKFTLKAPAGTSYKLALYVDINGDGKFAPEENIDVNVYATLPSGGRGNIVTTLQGGKTYIVERTVSDRVGSISWKLDIVKGSTVYSSLEGVSAIKANGSEVEDLCILQILPDVMPPTVYLPQNGEVNGSTVTGVPDAAKAVTEKFWRWTRDINGMNIEFVRKKQDEVKADLEGNPNYLLNHYDMLIIGFADGYDSRGDNIVMDAIEQYIASGRAVLFTHDSSAFIGEGSIGATFTKRFRDSFGMDRYDVLEHAGKTGVDRADYPYLPVGDSADKGKLAEVVSGSTRYLLTQGFANGALLRFDHAPGAGDDLLITTQVTQVNKGAITEYPYKIPEKIAVTATHPQYYQLDLERGDVVVWYCLGSNPDWSSEWDSTVKAYYNATPNDVRNNYYIYNVKNVTYSGVGHSGSMTDDEIRLFINTFVAAYRATAKPVQAIIVNDDAALNGSSGEYFMCVDVNSSDAGKAFGNDIVESYQLQKADGSGYALDRTEMAQSKRVYFYIKNANTYGNVMYDLTLSVNGTETPLAIFKKDGDVFMDTKTSATKFKASAADVYYVDVPLTIETAVDGKQAVGTTGLTIDIAMTYGDEGTTTDPSETVAYIIPRGLFDLD